MSFFHLSQDPPNPPARFEVKKVTTKCATGCAPNINYIKFSYSCRLLFISRAGSLIKVSRVNLLYNVHYTNLTHDMRCLEGESQPVAGNNIRNNKEYNLKDEITLVKFNVFSALNKTPHSLPQTLAGSPL